MSGDAAAVCKLQVELALATRELDACRDHCSIGPGSRSSSNGSIVLSTKLVQAIEAAIQLSGHLFGSAKAQRREYLSHLL